MRLKPDQSRIHNSTSCYSSGSTNKKMGLRLRRTDCYLPMYNIYVHNLKYIFYYIKLVFKSKHFFSGNFLPNSLLKIYFCFFCIFSFFLQYKASFFK
jgi:hypothetical protein